MIPEFDLSLCPPGSMTAPNIVGSAIEAGKSMSGITNSANVAGGGLVMVKYANIQLRYATGAPLRYWSKLGAMLNGGVRSILVPLLVDHWAPVVAGLATPVSTFFSDGSSFASSSPFAQPSPVIAETLSADAAVNAGTLTMRMGSRALFGGEWFEIAGPTKSSRAYCITEVDSMNDNGDGTITYTVGIRPPLREAAPNGTVLRFDRPRCLMRLMPGTSITAEVSSLWKATPDVTFVESFGST